MVRGMVLFAVMFARVGEWESGRVGEWEKRFSPFLPFSFSPILDHTRILNVSDVTAYDQSQEEDGCRPPSSGRRELVVGERFVYSVEVGPLKAGVSQSEITGITQINGRPCYSIVSQTTSSGAFSVLYKVDDYLESFVDAESLASRGIRKRIREGTYKLDSNAVYDQERRIMVSGDDTIAVPPCVQDIVSGFYYLRMLDLQPGDMITLDTYDNKKLHPLRVHVLRRERVTVKAGTFDCLVVEPVLLQPVGLFRRKGKFTMWLTDDHRKLPVLMKSEIIIGSVAVKLIEYRPGTLGDGMKNEK